MRQSLMIAAAALLMAAPLRADEEKVPLDKVPKAVMGAVKKRFPKAEVAGASKETEAGKTVFEVELKAAGKTIDVIVTADGTITTIEQEIDAKDLPKAVAGALEKKYPKATYKTVEAVYAAKDGKEALDFYEVLLTAGEKTFEVKVLADGKIKSEEEKKPEKKEGKKEDKDEDNDGKKEEKGDLSDKLADAVKSKFPGAKVKSVEKEDEGGRTVYEVTLKSKGVTLEVVFTATGQVEKVEVKSGEDEHEEKGDKKKSKKEDDEKAEGKKGDQKAPGFQGEQQGQNEDKKGKKKGADDNEKGKKKKGERN